MSWLSGWAKRRQITIDHNDIDENLTDFPVLLHLSTNSGINGADVTSIFDEVESNSKKIAVTTSDGVTQCYVEVEKWDATNKEAWLWVKVPSISATEDTVLYIYYDNTQPDNTTYVGDPGETPAQNVWDSNFVLVTHMRDDPDSSHIRDSTSYANNGTKKGAGEPAVTANGKIDDAQDFDGTDDVVEIPDDDSLDVTSEITLEAWIKLDVRPSSIPRHFTIISKEYTYWMLVSQGSDKIQLYISGEVADQYAYSTTALEAGEWYYVAGTYRASDGQFRIYINGVLETDLIREAGNIRTSIYPVKIGTLWSNFLDGIIDEPRISNVARSPAWIKATYETERDHLLTYGSEETPPTPLKGLWLFFTGK